MKDSGLSDVKDEFRDYLDEFVDTVKEIAAEELRSNGEIPPTLTVTLMKGDERVIGQSALDFSSIEKKERSIISAAESLFESRLEAGTPTSIVLVSEVWVSTEKEGEFSGLLPSENPNRIECLMIAGLDITFNRKVMMFDIIRNGDNVSLKERNDKDCVMRTPLLDKFFMTYSTRLVESIGNQALTQ